MRRIAECRAVDHYEQQIRRAVVYCSLVFTGGYLSILCVCVCGGGGGGNGGGGRCSAQAFLILTLGVLYPVSDQKNHA